MRIEFVINAVIVQNTKNDRLAHCWCKTLLESAVVCWNYANVNNRGVYLCNAILVTEIFCYRYSTFNNFSKI